MMRTRYDRVKILWLLIIYLFLKNSCSIIKLLQQALKAILNREEMIRDFPVRLLSPALSHKRISP